MPPSSDARPWLIMAACTLPGDSDSERLVIERVAAAVEELHLAEPFLTRLKTAVGEAVFNFIEHGLSHQAETPIPLRVCVYTSPAQLANRQSARGWGFFLIEKMADTVRSPGANNHHRIELYLYQEGEV